MAKSNFGPALGRGKKHRFDVGSIVRCRGTNIKLSCTEDGSPFKPGEAHGGFSFDAVMYIVKRLAVTPTEMLWRDETEMPVYVAQIIPSVDIQPANHFKDHLGYHYIVRDDCMTQTPKEKKAQELCAYDYSTRKFDKSRLRRIADEAMKEAMIEGSKGESGDR